MNSGKLLLFIIGVFLFSACEKDSVVMKAMETPSSNDLNVVDGKLAFNNFQQLSSMMINLSTLTEDEYVDWMKAYPGFDSYKEKFWIKSDELTSIRDKGALFDFLDDNENILTLSADSTVTEIFGSDIFSYVVDAKGQVILGDSIGVLTDKSFVVMSKGKYQEYGGELSNKHETYENEEGIQIFHFFDTEHSTNHEFQLANASIKNTPNSLYPTHTYISNLATVQYWTQPGIGTWTFFDKTYTDDKRRLHIRFEMSNMGSNGWIFVVKTKSQLKGLFGIWSANKTNHHFDFIDNNHPAGMNGDGPTTFTTTFNEVKEVNMIVGRSFLASQYYFNGYAKIWSRGVPVALGAGN